MAKAHADKNQSSPVVVQQPSSTFFPPANSVQKQDDATAAGANVTNFLSMINLDEANASNNKTLNQFSNERYLLALFLDVPFEVTTSKPASNIDEDITPLTLSIAEWQYDYINDKSGKFKKDKAAVKEVNGKYKDTVNALVENGFDPKGKNNNWAATDRADAAAVLNAEKEYSSAVLQNNTEETVRHAIVSLALSQTGTVVSVDRGDGSKFGWERIARFYEVAQDEFNGSDQFKRVRNDEGEPVDVPKSKDVSKSKLAGIKAANTYANDKTADWSWCGIFTVWAIRSITGKGSWNGGPKGFGELKTDITSAKKGDIIYIRHSSNPNNHHIILAEDIPADAGKGYTISTIEGNIDLQGIKATRRWKLSDIAGYYSVV